jgi:hypothetical protein
MILYHGTTTKHLKSIIKNGLVPRGKGKGNYEGKVASRPDLVYLTTTYAAYYALCARTEDESEKPVVIKIELDVEGTYGHPPLLFPDEDFLYHALSRKVPLEEINPWDYQEHWKKSIDYMGVVAIERVLPKQIMGYTILDVTDIVRHCDPSVSPINYKFCGSMYRDYLESKDYSPLK